MRNVFILSIAGLMLAAPATAFAHAHLDHATPAVGSTVAQAPKEVVMWFTESLEAAFSTAEVRDAQGKPVQAGKARFDKANPAQMRVPLQALKPGTYKVFWRVLSVDTHRTQGDFSFRVGP
jgi:hypothetical protein